MPPFNRRPTLRFQNTWTGLALAIVASLSPQSAFSQVAPSFDASQSQLQTSPLHSFRNLLRTEIGTISQDTLRQTFCDEPQNFCDAVRELTPAQRLEAFHSAESDISSMPPGFHRLEVLSQPEAQTAAIETLRDPTHPEQPAIQSLYQGKSWARLNQLNASAIQALTTHLSNPTLAVPKPVIEKLAQLKLLNPFDESIPLEKRREFLASCGLGDDWNQPKAASLGELIAFANKEGYVIVCPKTILAENNEGLMTILLHEISHQIGPCLVGASILAQIQTESCEVDSRAQPELSPWLDWLGRTQKLERCFHRAGINSGSDAEWLSRFLVRELKRENNDEEEESCSDRVASQLMPSERLGEGLLATCDPTQSKLVVAMITGMGLADEELKSPGKRVQKIARFAQLKLGALEASIRAQMPDTNQFNEAFSDVLAAKLLEKAMKDFHQNMGRRGALEPNAILAGVSALCAQTSNWKLKGEAHSRDDRRFEIFSSQPEFRKILGCQSRLPTALSRRLSQCEGLGL
jgi:hypothetical protein